MYGQQASMWSFSFASFLFVIQSKQDSTCLHSSLGCEDTNESAKLGSLF